MVWRDGDRPAYRIAATAMRRLDGRPAIEVTVYDAHADGGVRQVVRVYESGSHRSWRPELGPYWKANATVYTYAGETLTLIEHVVAGSVLAPGGGLEEALREARVALQRPDSRRITWDGRPSVADPVADPGRAWDALAEPLADALRTAAGRVSHLIGPVALLHVAVRANEDLQQPELIGAAVMDDGFLDRVAGRRAGVRRALAMAEAGADGAAAVEPLAVLSANDLARVTVGLQANRHDPDAFQRLATELATLLADLPVLVSVAGDDPFRPSRSALGDALVTERVARLESDADVSDAFPTPEHAALAARLVAAGLGPDVARDVALDAAWAITLESGGDGTTQVGGLPLVPPGTDWPRHDGRPLAHLATIAFGELPRVPGGEALPRAGTLAIFADLDEEAEFYEPVEPGEPGGTRIALIEAPEDGATLLDAPPDAKELPEGRVTPTTGLQLRQTGFGSGRRRFGIEPDEETLVLEVRWAAFGRPPRPQLLGFPLVVQDDPRDDGDVALLHVDPDVLGVPFLDGGDILFFLRAEDLEAHRWDQVTAWPSSC